MNENEKRFPGYGNVVKPPSEDYIPGRASSIGRVNNKLSDAGVDDIHFMMINMGHADMSRMREAVFIKVFLPVLSGEVNDPELFAKFIEGCGGMGRWAEIIDERGNVLFLVPPIIDTNHLDLLSKKNSDTPSIANIVAMVEMLQHISPIQAQNHFDKAVMGRIAAAHTSKNVMRYETEWRAIFERYGIKQKAINDNANGDKPAGTSTSAAGTAGTPANQVGGMELDDGANIW